MKGRACDSLAGELREACIYLRRHLDRLLICGRLSFIRRLIALVSVVVVVAVVIALITLVVGLIIILTILISALCVCLIFFSTLENPEPRYVVELFAFTSILGGIAIARIRFKGLFETVRGKRKRSTPTTVT